MKKIQSIEICVPSYNEELCIEQTIRSIHKWIKSLSFLDTDIAINIHCVDNCSEDLTVPILLKV